MVKKNPQYDPEFKINAPRINVYARQTLNSKSFGTQKLNVKHWTPKQQQFYLKFIENNKNKFLDPKKWKIFSLMSKQIKTRSSQQCKTHHAKMILKSKKGTKTFKQTLLSEESCQSQHIIQVLAPEIQQMRTQSQQMRQISQLNHENDSSLFDDSSKIPFQQQNIFDVLALRKQVFK